MENFIETILKNSLDPASKEIGQTLGYAFNFVFGGFNSFAEKKKIKRQHDVEQYALEIGQRISEIPNENLIEPRMSIVGPALEASRYYIEEDELRIMFANLIASSMNSETTSLVHPSYIEIIKQLTPLDAQNLTLFSTHSTLPIVNYNLEISNGLGYALYQNVFLENDGMTDIPLQAQSITNLSRLGLVSIDYDRKLHSTDAYKKYYIHPFYIDLKREVEELFSLGEISLKSITIQCSIVRTTPYGESFIDACLTPTEQIQ